MSSLTQGLLVVLCMGQAMAYIQRFFEHDMVCSIMMYSSNIELIGREDQSALVIKDNNYFKSFTGNQEFKCKFTVSSSLGLGVFAVIQQMSLRRDAQGKCIDYVQFRHSEKTLNFLDINLKIKSSEGWSDQICGDINALEMNDDDSNQGSDKNEDKEIKNSFIDHKGKIEVKIYLGNKSVGSNEELNLEIVFTSFQECKYNNSLWRQCSRRTCIFKDFMDDDKRNCPYKSCKESVCHSVISADGNYLNTTFGTKVMAGTVACLFTMFIVFIAFLWIFRHCGTAFCCMGSPNSHPHSSEMQPVPNLDTMVIIATAPPSTVVASGTENRTADKDLPPSYDSLFPSK